MYQKIIKPALNILGALIALPVFLLCLFIFGPLIFLEDKGPIFYCAPRMGKNGKRFIMFKFRTMRVNAPDVRNPDGSTFNSENDPRLTKIGKFLRKTSLDEIPQLINIFLGDMGVVGPRPTLYSDKYQTLSEQRKKILTVRPGITGYVGAYFRNSIDQDKKFEYDAWYADNVSFCLDVKIIFKTFHSVFKRKNVFYKQDTPANKQKLP